MKKIHNFMTSDEAREVQMTVGAHKGKRLCELPLPYLKWIAKNWIRKELRDAAILVIEGRSQDLNQKTKARIEYNSNRERLFKGMEYHDKPPLDFSKGAFGKLKEELQEAPPGLF